MFCLYLKVHPQKIILVHHEHHFQRNDAPHRIKLVIDIEMWYV